jgi:hypothetical protein
MDQQLAIQILITSVPVGIAGLVAFFLASGFRSARAGSEERMNLWWRVGLVLLLAALVVMLSRPITGTWPQWLPTRSDQWMPWIGLAAGVLGVVAALVERRAHRWMVPVVIGLTLLGVGGVVLCTHARILDSIGGLGWMRTLAPAMLLGSLYASGFALLARRSGPAPGGAAAIIAGGTAVLLVVGFASLTQGRLAGVIAAYIAGAALVCLGRPSTSIGVGLGVMSGIYLAATAVQSWAFGSSSASWTMGLIACAPWTVLALHARLKPDSVSTTTSRSARGGLPFLMAHWIAGALWIVAAILLNVVLSDHARRDQPGGASISDYQ